MVEIESAVNTVLETIFVSHLCALLRGTSPITDHTGAHAIFDLSSVPSDSYTTIFSRSFDIEDVGLIDIFNISTIITVRLNGNGSMRWQISGDGGSNFVTFIEELFNNVVFTPLTRSGSGLWITSINTGVNKLQIRMQVLASSGTVDSKISDLSSILIQYRQKLRSTD